MLEVIEKSLLEQLEEMCEAIDSDTQAGDLWKENMKAHFEEYAKDSISRIKNIMKNEV